MTRVDNGDYQFIIAPKLNWLARKMWEPECVSQNYRKKFLPFNADTLGGP